MSVNDYRRIDALSTISVLFEWDKWRQEIPYIKFKRDWEVRAIPPVICGIIRYNIRHTKIENSFVSIYLDCYDLVGFYGGPYWEVYPVGGDCERVGIMDTESLIKAVTKSFREQKKQEISK